MAGCGLPCSCERFCRLRRPIASRRDQRIGVGGVQSRPLARVARLPALRLVRHRDRLAEMGDRLLEGRTAQSLVPRLAPPFNREIVEAGFGEMMGNDFRFGRRALGIRPKEFGRSLVQRLAAALKQALVGRVLDQRVLEAVGSGRRGAVDKQEVGFREPIQRGLEAQLVESGRG